MRWALTPASFFEGPSLNGTHDLGKGGVTVVCSNRKQKLQTISLTTAEQFLEYLRPSANHWWDHFVDRPSHVFRGHADADWQLIPKGWRPLDDNPHVSALMRAVAWSSKQVTELWSLRNEDQAIFWRFALSEAAIQFAQLGRNVGLEIPWEIQRSLITSPWDYVPYIDISLLALAQHHGVPTQLLDWSDDPLTAAFFAIGENVHFEKDLCVWALKLSEVPRGDGLSVTLTTPPNIGNSNMRAQSGIFLAHTQGPHLNDVFINGAWPSFESNEHIAKGLLKITLPGSQRQKLQSLLIKEKRSEAHLMPSWDSVAKTLKKEWATSSLWSGAPALARPNLNHR